jgi:molybdate transport system substrate-binding protein
MFSTMATFSRAVLLGASLMSVAAYAAELTLASTPAASAAIREVVPHYERATGHKVAMEFANIATLRKRIAAGESFDITMVSPRVIEELIQQGKIAPGTQLNLGRSGLALVMGKGTPKPDISSVDAFKRMLLSANSIAYSATGESGIGFLSVLNRLGITAEMKPRIAASSNMAATVEAGQAQFGITGVGAALAYHQLDYAGPLPAGIQEYINVAAGISATTKEPQAARDLLKFLADPATTVMLRSKGLEPN